jgi:probable HAF family extracellular repeat protein
MPRFKSRVLGMAGLALLPGVSFAATGYNVTGITPPSGDDITFLFALNDSDQIVGIADNVTVTSTGLSGVSFTSGGGVEAGYLFTASSATLLPTLGANSKGETVTFPDAINDSGEVVGQTTTPAGYVPFSYQDGTLTNLATALGVTGATNSFLSNGSILGINSSGELTGSVEVVQGNSVGYVYNGKLTEFGPLPGLYVGTIPDSINSSGAVVGGSNYNDANGAGGHAFEYSGGVLTDLGTLPGTNYSIATGINDSGEIIGWSGETAKATGTGKATLSLDQEAAVIGSGIGGIYISEPSFAFTLGHGFIYDSSTKTMTDLGTLGGTFSAAFGINDSGEIVGTSLTASGAYDAFIDNGTTMTDLNSLLPADSGWDLISADGINSNGDIIGMGELDGTFEGFLLTAGGTISGSGGNGGSTGQSGGGGNSGTAVPVPMAAYSGLGVLIALGAFSKLRLSKFRAE